MNRTQPPFHRRTALTLATLTALALAASQALAQAADRAITTSGTDTALAQAAPTTEPLRDLNTPPAPPSPGSTQPPAAAVARPAAPASEAPEVQTFTLREVRFPLTQAVDRAALQATVAPFIGQRIGQSELQALTQALQATYEERGYGLAAIGFPSQNLSSGVLTVAIIEPRLGRSSVQASPEARLPDSRVPGLLRYFGIEPGQPLSLAALDRVMFALNDLPGIGAKANLSPSGDEGVFDLMIELEARKAVEGSLELDNQGNRNTGEYRLGGLVRWNNPLGLGDNLDLRVLRTSDPGLTLGRLAYELPVGDTPARASFGASRVSYVLGAPFDALDANGVATVFDTAFSYPLIRSRERNLVMRLSAEQKNLDDRFDALDFDTKKRIRNLVAALSFEGSDGLLGGGYTGAAFQAQFGHLTIRSDNVRADDASLGEQATQGDFEKFSLQASRLQAITQTFSFYAGFSGQYASKNLDGAEKITLGGPHAVRAYSGAESPADQAMVLTTELRWFLDPRFTVFAFHDRAKGWLRKHPDAGDENLRALHGSGVGLHFTDPDWFTLSATVAWRGHQAPLAGTDEDRRPRLYVQLQRAF